MQAHTKYGEFAVNPVKEKERVKGLLMDPPDGTLYEVPPSDDSSTVNPVKTDAVPKLVGAVHDTVKLVVDKVEANTAVGGNGTVGVKVEHVTKDEAVDRPTLEIANTRNT